MKKRFISLLIFLIAAGVFFAIPSHVQAASEKAVKITATYKDHPYKNETQRLVIKGISNSGKTVWTYKTKYDGSWDTIHYFTHKNRVYVCTRYKMTCLNLNNGKKIWAKNLKPVYTAYFSYYAFDKNDNLYVTDANSKTVVKVNKKGKIKWKVTSGIYAMKIKYKNGKVIVTDTEASSGEVYKVTLSAKTGKILKRYYKK